MSSSYTIDQKRWSQKDIFDQMGNIYSEVGRAFKTRGQDDLQDHNAAVARATDLFNATIQSLASVKSPKTKEVQRAKEQFLQVVDDPRASKKEIQGLDRYFMQFAIAARLNR